MTERVARLRQRSYDAEPRISAERAELITDFYRENEGKHAVPLLRALAFRHLCERKTVYIGEDELIVGERGPAPKVVPTFPELTCHSVEDLEILNSRPKTWYRVDDECLRRYREQVIPYWRGRSMRDRLFAELPPEWKEAYAAGLFTEFMEQRAPGHTVATSDLYRMGFNPVSDRHNFNTVNDPVFLKLQLEELHAAETHGFAPRLEAEIAKVEAADLMIWQFPLWWFGLPGILKGWVDRVFAMGRTYGYGHIYETGRFAGKRALLSLTTGGPEEAYRKDGFNGDLEVILKPVHRGILNFTGFAVLAPQVVCAPVRADDAQRAAWLSSWARRLGAIEQEVPIEVGRY